MHFQKVSSVQMCQLHESNSALEQNEVVTAMLLVFQLVKQQSVL